MYQEHSVTKLPADLDAAIWRHISLAKFLDLLRTSELYFARADNLNDPFEGSWPLGAIRRRQERYVDSEKTFQWLSHEFKTGSYLSCWHNSRHESAAMWDLYLNSSEGIAIRSTCRRLIEAFANTKENIYVAEVRYIDYRTDDFEEALQDNSLTPLVYKRLSFEHEKELRAIACRASSADTPINGIRIVVELNALIEAVFVFLTLRLGSNRLLRTLLFGSASNFRFINQTLPQTPSIDVTQRRSVENPNGISSISPGLERSDYPGSRVPQNISNPNGVASRSSQFAATR